MSWDIYLTDDRGHSEGEWNYTHNCNGMIEAALGDATEGTPEPFWSVLAGGKSGMGRRSWWSLLDGCNGPEGAALLDRIISGMEADPERFRAMNPPNGWGDYDSLLRVLRSMRAAVPDWPTTWAAHG